MVSFKDVPKFRGKNVPSSSSNSRENGALVALLSPVAGGGRDWEERAAKVPMLPNRQQGSQRKEGPRLWVAFGKRAAADSTRALSVLGSLRTDAAFLY